MRGQFLPMTYDLAMMFPMFEMASQGHIHFIKEPIYIVNTVNPISDRRKNLQLQRNINKYLRSLPPYAPLQTLLN
ncbi:MAG TPA: hypothetical protein VN457_01240, partial [Chlamydiales bacterium]|nr:hypothetical protein [Chlamydiales bacterium]